MHCEVIQFATRVACVYSKKIMEFLANYSWYIASEGNRDEASILKRAKKYPILHGKATFFKSLFRKLTQYSVAEQTLLKHMNQKHRCVDG